MAEDLNIRELSLELNSEHIVPKMIASHRSALCFENRTEYGYHSYCYLEKYSTDRTTEEQKTTSIAGKTIVLVFWGKSCSFYIMLDSLESRHVELAELFGPSNDERTMIRIRYPKIDIHSVIHRGFVLSLLKKTVEFQKKNWRRENFCVDINTFVRQVYTRRMRHNLPFQS